MFTNKNIYNSVLEQRRIEKTSSHFPSYYQRANALISSLLEFNQHATDFTERDT